MRCPKQLEDRTRPRIEIISDQQLCDYFEKHRADRSLGKSGESQQKRFGDRNSIR